MKLILASQSPRRKELLGYYTNDFQVRVSQADETLPEGIDPGEAVALLAQRKAQAVAALPECKGCRIIGADTVVAVEGHILGKPHSPEEAREMLELLSGRVHSVYTGVAVLGPGEREVFTQRTQVEFYPLSAREIDDYVATGEPMDKAGAYGIQGRGGLLVRRLEGDYFNVMGLPVARLARVLKMLEQGEKAGG